MVSLVERVVIVQLYLECFFLTLLFYAATPRVLVTPCRNVSIGSRIVIVHLIRIFKLLLVVLGNPIIISNTCFQTLQRSLPFGISVYSTRFPYIIGITGDILIENSGTRGIVTCIVYIIRIVISISMLSRPVLEHCIIRLPVIIQSRYSHIMARFDTSADAYTYFKILCYVSFYVTLDIGTVKIKPVNHRILVGMRNTYVIIDALRTTVDADVTIPHRRIFINNKVLPVEAGVHSLSLTP